MLLTEVISFGAVVREDQLQKLGACLSLNSLSLDCGCGRGLYSKCLGLSISLDINRKLLRKLCLKSERVVGDATRLPFRQGVFDRVYAISVLEHLDDTKALTEICAVTKNGGNLIILVPRKNAQFFYSLCRLDCLHDVGHLRLYNLQEIVSKLSRLNLKVTVVKFIQNPLAYLLEHVTLKLLLLKGRNVDNMAPENIAYGKPLESLYSIIMKLLRNILLFAERITPDILKGELLIVTKK